MFPALLALKQNECNMAYRYRKNRSPYWYMRLVNYASALVHEVYQREKWTT
jgi:hypothetical protein